jgi:uncharacterized repeat protein (TIGR02543 family)
MPAEDVTFTATWTPVIITLYYDITYLPGTEDTVNNMPANIDDQAAGTSQAVASGTPTRAGYTFNGWTVNPSTIPTASGAAFDMPASDVTFIATWNLNQEGPTYYTVTYAPGTHGTFDPVVYPGLALGTTTPPAPTATGSSSYKFDGWSPKPTATVTGTIIYVAQWERKSSSYEEPTPEVVIEETPAPEAPIVITPAPEEVPEEIIIVDESKPLGELPKTGTGPMPAAPSQAPAYLPEELVLNFKDEDEDEIA